MSAERELLKTILAYMAAKEIQVRLAQPEQEPVAWMSKEKGDVNKSREYFKLVEKYQNETILPLYTSPPVSRKVGRYHD